MNSSIETNATQINKIRLKSKFSPSIIAVIKKNCIPLNIKWFHQGICATTFLKFLSNYQFLFIPTFTYFSYLYNYWYYNQSLLITDKAIGTDNRKQTISGSTRSIFTQLIRKLHYSSRSLRSIFLQLCGSFFIFFFLWRYGHNPGSFFNQISDWFLFIGGTRSYRFQVAGYYGTVLLYPISMADLFLEAFLYKEFDLDLNQFQLFPFKYNYNNRRDLSLLRFSQRGPLYIEYDKKKQQKLSNAESESYNFYGRIRAHRKEKRDYNRGRINARKKIRRATARSSFYYHSFRDYRLLRKKNKEISHLPIESQTSNLSLYKLIGRDRRIF
jgi:hypothetical protein